VIAITLLLCVVAGAGVASANAKPFPDLPEAPAVTSRYQSIDDMLAMRNDITDLRRDLFAAHKRITALEDDVRQLELKRGEDLKRMYRLESFVYLTGCPR
jgi:hypothetical protein